MHRTFKAQCAKEAIVTPVKNLSREEGNYPPKPAAEMPALVGAFYRLRASAPIQRATDDVPLLPGW